MPQATQVQPSNEAVELGEALLERDDLHATVLQEAEETDTEAGRTICGSTDQVEKEPTARAHEAIALPFCPLDSRAVIHGGGGHDFERPRLSLLDMSDVLFGASDASLLVGAEQSELMLAPSDDSKTAAQQVFRDAVGMDIDSHGEMVQARQDHLITPQEAQEARDIIRQQLGPLFRQVQTPHPEFVEGTVATPAPVLGAINIQRATREPAERVGNIMAALDTIFSELFSLDPEPVEVNLVQLLVSSIGTALVTALFLALIGGTPQQLIRSGYL